MSFVSFAAIFFGILSVVCSQGIEQKTSFIFFHGPTADHYIEYPFDQVVSMLTHTNFNKSRKTTLCLHGNNESPFVPQYRPLVEAYLTRNDQNLVMLNWKPLVNQTDVGYITTSVPNAIAFAKPLARKIDELCDKGLILSSLHVVGHSLGAQLAGMVGRELQKLPTGRKLERISALDAAFPPWFLPQLPPYIPAMPPLPYEVPQSLGKGDAKFVDCIHTDSGYYGAPKSIGHADFWPNGGKAPQPGCPAIRDPTKPENDLCSHHRAVALWTESVGSKRRVFYSIKSGSWLIFRLLGWVGPFANMGIDCQKDVRGDWYLTTNAASPFSRGMAGTKYSSAGK